MNTPQYLLKFAVGSSEPCFTGGSNTFHLGAHPEGY